MEPVRHSQSQAKATGVGLNGEGIKDCIFLSWGQPMVPGSQGSDVCKDSSMWVAGALPGHTLSGWQAPGPPGAGRKLWGGSPTSASRQPCWKKERLIVVAGWCVRRRVTAEGHQASEAERGAGGGAGVQQLGVTAAAAPGAAQGVRQRSQHG